MGRGGCQGARQSSVAAVGAAGLEGWQELPASPGMEGALGDRVAELMLQLGTRGRVTMSMIVPGSVSPLFTFGLKAKMGFKRLGQCRISREEVFRFGSVRFGLVRFGLVWFLSSCFSGRFFRPYPELLVHLSH